MRLIFSFFCVVLASGCAAPKPVQVSESSSIAVLAKKISSNYNKGIALILNSTLQAPHTENISSIAETTFSVRGAIEDGKAIVTSFDTYCTERGGLIYPHQSTGNFTFSACGKKNVQKEEVIFTYWVHTQNFTNLTAVYCFSSLAVENINNLSVEEFTKTSEKRFKVKELNHWFEDSGC